MLLKLLKTIPSCYLVKSDTDLDLPSLARALYWADQMVCNSGGLFAPSAEYFNCFLYSTFKSFLWTTHRCYRREWIYFKIRYNFYVLNTAMHAYCNSGGHHGATLYGGVLERHENYQYFQQIADKDHVFYGVLVTLKKVSLDECISSLTVFFCTTCFTPNDIQPKSSLGLKTKQDTPVIQPF